MSLPPADFPHLPVAVGRSRTGRLLVVWLLAAVAVALATNAPTSAAATNAESIGAVPMVAVSVTAGASHTCALLSNGTAACWGTNTSGELGNATNTGSNIPVAVNLPAGTTATAISAGLEHTCAILDNGTTTCWGDNFQGQLGNGSNSDSNLPVTVNLPTGTTATAISAGFGSTCAILDNGTATCWGNNFQGQLGNGSNSDSNVPVTVNLAAFPAGTTVTAITAGFVHTCAILDDGTAVCWGDNSELPLGTPGVAGAYTPVAVALPAGTTATAITAGGFHSCAILDNGTTTCWGNNASGQLGNATTTASSIPVTVDFSAFPAGTTAATITAGVGNTCALLDNGTATCWGDNFTGRLGNATTASSNVPVTVDLSAFPTGTTATAIDAGNAQTCAILDDGTATCWGGNQSGEIGNATNTGALTPQVVGGPPAPSPATTNAEISTQAQLSWTPGAVSAFGPVIAWTIEQSTDAGASWTPATLAVAPAAGDTAATITGLTNGTAYLFRVAGINNATVGPFAVSNPVTPTAPPIPTLAATTTSPTDSNSIQFSVVFDQDVTGFDSADITATGSAAATTATVTSVDAATYTIDVSGMTNDGAVTITVPAGAATNVNAQTSTTSNTVTIDYDTTGPIASIDIAPGQNDPTDTLPVTFSISFDEAPVGFNATDLTVGGTAGATTANLTGAGTQYIATIDTVASAGTITLDLPAGVVTDTVGNPSGITIIIDSTVTLDDTVGPDIVVPDGGVQASTDPGQPGAIVTYTVTATDPDPTPAQKLTANRPVAAALGATPTVDCTPASGSFFPIGATTVACTASDAVANTATATFDVTITDNEDPTIIGTDQSFDLPVGAASGPIGYIIPTATDNSGGATVECTPRPGTNFNAGATTIECSATDPSGNTTTANYTVTGLIRTAPPITVPGGSLPATGSNSDTALTLTLALALLALGTFTRAVSRRRGHT